MKKITLLLFSVLSVSIYGQVSSVTLKCKGDHPCLSEMKNATVHVIIKDFCDDSKPYKRVLEKAWKYSKLKFDYSEKYDNVNENSKGSFENGEWYMYLNRYFDSRGGGPHSSAQVNYTCTKLSIGKGISKKNNEVENIIEIPLFPAPGEEVGIPKAYITQKVDVQKCFFNIENEYYFENILQILNQFVDNESSSFKDYMKSQVKCDSLKKIVASTLYLPKYVLLESSKYKTDIQYVNPTEYFDGYESSYKILTNEEMIQMFKAKKTFYYLLWAAEAGTKYNFIIEGITGKIMSIGYSQGSLNYNINKKDMQSIYEKDLIEGKRCK